MDTTEKIDPAAVSGAGGSGPLGAFVGAMLILGIVALAMLPGLGARDFWPPDEARYGEVAREMWAGGDPAVPHLNGTVYYDKPPGYFWAVLGAARIHGALDEWAARLPSVAGAALMALSVFWMLGPRTSFGTAMMGALVSLGSVSVVWQGRSSQLDCLFAGLISMGMAAFFRAADRQRPKAVMLGFFLCGLSVLVKGPLCLVMMVGGFLGALCCRRGRMIFNRWFVVGFVLFLLPTTAWFGWAWLDLDRARPGSGLDYIQTLIDTQVLGRINVARASERPWHWYISDGFPKVAAPFFLLPLGLLFPSARYALSAGARRLSWFALGWFVVSFVAQSYFPGKRVNYLVPLMPAVAILAAVGVHGVVTAWPRAGFRLLATICGILGVVVTAAGLLLAANVDDSVAAQFRDRAEPVIERRAEKIVKDEQDDESDAPNGSDSAPASRSYGYTAPESRPSSQLAREMIAALDWNALRHGLTLAGIVILALGIASLATLASGALRASVAWLALAVAVGGGLALGYVFPLLDPLVSHQPAALAIREALQRHPADAPVGFFRHLDEAFPFYMARPAPEIASVREPWTTAQIREEARRFLMQRGSLLIVRGDKLAEFGLREFASGRIVGPLRAGGKQFFALEGPP